ncbi:MAG: DUF5320 domain-containing protein [Eubacteriales bacterium]|nr:DUF5320 domain-containing protein [Eubacteriales bacterium]
MPFMDGTGPRWQGRGAAGCGCGRHAGHGAFGPGYGAGYGRGLGYCRHTVKDEREALTAEKDFLNNRLSEVEKRIESL